VALLPEAPGTVLDIEALDHQGEPFTAAAAEMLNRSRGQAIKEAFWI